MNRKDYISDSLIEARGELRSYCGQTGSGQPECQNNGEIPEGDIQGNAGRQMPSEQRRPENRLAESGCGTAGIPAAQRIPVLDGKALFCICFSILAGALIIAAALLVCLG